MLRTRPPRSTPEGARARLACIRHAASVDPEPGSNSPPMLHRLKRQSPEARCRSELPAPSAPPKRSRTLPKDVAPAGVLVAACDGHACYAGLLLCASPMRSWPQTPLPKEIARAHAPIRSLRLRHPTRWPLRSRPRRHPQPIRPLRQLVNVLPRSPVTAAARPMRRPPLHPLHPAARSTLGGRSSPEPAKPTLRPAPCQGLGTVSLRSAFPRKGRAKELSPVSRETLHTASINFGNPISLLRHHYYVK